MGLQPLGEVLNGIEYRASVAATLGASSSDNASPMFLLFDDAFWAESDLAAVGKQWGDGMSAEFNGFFDGPVHFFGAR